MLHIDGRLLGPIVGTTFEPGTMTNGINMSEVLDRECRRHGHARLATCGFLRCCFTWRLGQLRLGVGGRGFLRRALGAGMDAAAASAMKRSHGKRRDAGRQRLRSRTRVVNTVSTVEPTTE